jgi:hypothetical protein
VENSIVNGRHLYATSTISDTCYGIIHAFVMSHTITNAEHNRTRTFLRRLLTMWIDHFTQDRASTGKADIISAQVHQIHPDIVTATAFTKSHIPQIETEVGFLDLVMVGNLVELADIINRASYNHTILPEDREEQNIARGRYRRFQVWFAEHFVVLMDKRWVSPFYVFKRSLLQVSAAIVGYKRDKDGLIKGPAYCTVNAVESALRRHFQKDWPELVYKLEKLLQSPPSEMFWTGPKICIQNRPREPYSPILDETIDFLPDPIFQPVIASADEEEAQGEDELDEDEGGQADDDQDDDEEVEDEHEPDDDDDDDDDAQEDDEEVEDENEPDGDEDVQADKRRDDEKEAQGQQNDEGASQGQPRQKTATQAVHDEEHPDDSSDDNQMDIESESEHIPVEPSTPPPNRRRRQLSINGMICFACIYVSRSYQL